MNLSLDPQRIRSKSGGMKALLCSSLVFSLVNCRCFMESFASLLSFAHSVKKCYQKVRDWCQRMCPCKKTGGNSTTPTDPQNTKCESNEEEAGQAFAYKEELAEIMNMGISTDMGVIKRLLNEHNGDQQHVVQELVAMQWTRDELTYCNFLKFICLFMYGMFVANLCFVIWALSFIHLICVESVPSMAWDKKMKPKWQRAVCLRTMKGVMWSAVTFDRIFIVRIVRECVYDSFLSHYILWCVLVGFGMV